ncbi:hypothetical protein SAVIM338S_03148 [Streptomyces avidinii]
MACEFDSNGKGKAEMKSGEPLRGPSSFRPSARGRTVDAITPPNPASGGVRVNA